MPRVELRVSVGQKAELERRAAALGVSVSDFVRLRCLGGAAGVDLGAVDADSRDVSAEQARGAEEFLEKLEPVVVTELPSLVRDPREGPAERGVACRCGKTTTRNVRCPVCGWMPR